MTLVEEVCAEDGLEEKWILVYLVQRRSEKWWCLALLWSKQKYLKVK